MDALGPGAGAENLTGAGYQANQTSHTFKLATCLIDARQVPALVLVFTYSSFPQCLATSERIAVPSAGVQIVPVGMVRLSMALAGAGILPPGLPASEL